VHTPAAFVGDVDKLPPRWPLHLQGILVQMQKYSINPAASLLSDLLTLGDQTRPAGSTLTLTLTQAKAEFTRLVAKLSYLLAEPTLVSLFIHFVDRPSHLFAELVQESLQLQKQGAADAKRYHLGDDEDEDEEEAEVVGGDEDEAAAEERWTPGIAELTQAIRYAWTMFHRLLWGNDEDINLPLLLKANILSQQDELDNMYARTHAVSLYAGQVLFFLITFSESQCSLGAALRARFSARA
jgi:hypothetical protein